MKQRKTILPSRAVFRILSFLLSLLVFSLPLGSCGKTPATPEDSTAGGDTTAAPGGDLPAPPATVYVTEKGAGKRDGSSPENAATLAEGLGMTKKAGGTVVVCGPLSFDGPYILPSNGASVTLTSVRDGVDYRETAGAKLSLSGDLSFCGDYLLEGLAITAEKSDLFFFFQYHNVTVGEDVVCARGAGASTDIALICGYSAPSSAYRTSYQISCRADAAVRVKSGTWQYIRGGNRRTQSKSAFGTVEEGVSFAVFVEGGTFTAAAGRDLSSASGMNGVAGAIYMEINGGSFAGPVCLLSRTGSNTENYPVSVTGRVTLKITGGDFCSKELAVRQPTSDKIALGASSETTLCVTGGTFPSGTLASGEAGSAVLLAEGVNVSASGFGKTLSGGADTITAPTLRENAVLYTAPPYPETAPKTGPLTAEEEKNLIPETAAALAKVRKLEKSTPASSMRLRDPDKLYSLDGVRGVKFVSMLTGEYSINKTITNYGIAGAGGGYMIDCGDTALLAFGDCNPEGELGKPWRANALAFTRDRDYTDGITLDGFYMGETFQRSPFSGEFLLSGHDTKNKTEESKIPTGGVKIGDTLYFCYMSVASWRENDRDGCWPCNYGGLAKSTDFGRSWETPSDLRWPAGTDVDDPVAEIPEWGLAQLYPVLDGDYVYFFGVPGGRAGYCRLMRVKAAVIENFSAYEYLTGRDEAGRGIFERGEAAMKTNFAAVDKCVGGVGVMYNEYLGEWLMFYCAKQAGSLKNSIVLRAAKTLDGVWSEPVLVMSQATFGSVYEPRVSSAYTREGGRYMMVITSRWDIYNSIIWEIELSKK